MFDLHVESKPDSPGICQNHHAGGEDLPGELAFVIYKSHLVSVRIH